MLLQHNIVLWSEHKKGIYFPLPCTLCSNLHMYQVVVQWYPIRILLLPYISDSILQSTCAGVNDYTRCQVVENQAQNIQARARTHLLYSRRIQTGSHPSLAGKISWLCRTVKTKHVERDIYLPLHLIKLHWVSSTADSDLSHTSRNIKYLIKSHQKGAGNGMMRVNLQNAN